jgi:phosphopantothenoylcysteine decarboxylase/phosphopantothenate--cysteine ligase
VAALKTPTLIRRLRQLGCEVRAAATEGAYAFVTPLSLSVAAGSPVLDRERWFAPDGGILHVTWAAWADGMVVAPATADALASAAHGRADDVVSALVVAGVPRVLWAPAMNPAMWRHAPVARNVETLRALGHDLVGPVEGPLASADEGRGVGRMADADAIAGRALGLAHSPDLHGRRVLVSAGPTREYLDPVRFLSNPSSGRTGYAVAEAARARGARVTLISGPTALEDPVDVRTVHVDSAEAMLRALEHEADDHDLLVMSAAVADWRPAHRSERKQRKEGDTGELALVRTVDILMRLASRPRPLVVVAFAMETHEGVERAARKAREKGAVFVALNYPARPGLGFGSHTNEVTLVRPDGSSEPLPAMSKRDLADVLLDRAREALPGAGG